MSATDVYITEEIKGFLDLFHRNNPDIDLQAFVDNAIIEAMSNKTREKLGGVMANPIQATPGVKESTELLREARESGEIARALRRLVQE